MRSLWVHLTFDHVIASTDIHVVLLGVVIPLVMLCEEDYFWRQAGWNTAVHLIACQHEIFRYFQVIGLVPAASVDTMKMSQSQQACKQSAHTSFATLQCVPLSLS